MEETSVMEMQQVAVASAGPKKIVRAEDVNWSVAAKDFWVVGGLPGAGKSDLLATAAGLIPPERGKHTLFGKEANALTEEELVELRARIGFVFSYGGRLFQHLTVAENVALPICYHQNISPAEAANRVEPIVELAGLSEYGHLRPDWVPRYLHPRVALARAMALAPDLLFLDNPLAGLAPRESRWWLDLLDQLAAGHPLFEKKPMTLVVGTDHLRPWREHGRQFALIQDKHWFALGDRAALSSISNPLARELLTAEGFGN